MNYLPDFQSSVDFLNEQLVESVEKHFISDVPVGLLLSGGNDSSLLAAISLFLGKRPIAYHLNINDGSDSYYAEKVIDHLKLDAIKIKMDDEMLVEQYEKIWNFLDEPTADSSVIPTSLIFSAIKGCSKVVLSGEGGDEMFGGYQRHAEIANKNKIKIQNKLLTFFNDIFYGYGGKKIRYINPVIHRAHNFYLKYFTDDSIGSYLACVKLAGFPYKQNNLRQDLYNLYSATDHALKLPAGLFYDRFMYLPNDLMYKGDISSMTSSIENRVPFLDKNLVSSIYNRIRPEYLLSKNFQNKLILKKVMEKYFPQELIYRKKKGFSFSFQRFDCPSFRNDIERALYFHKENLDIFGLRDSNFSRFIDIKNRDILFKKYPNLVFALVSNYRIFCRIL